jgi:hypothetical protein
MGHPQACKRFCCLPSCRELAHGDTEDPRRHAKRAETKRPNGCFVSVSRRTDYLRAISTVLPLFDGRLAT